MNSFYSAKWGNSTTVQILTIQLLIKYAKFF